MFEAYLLNNWSVLLLITSVWKMSLRRLRKSVVVLMRKSSVFVSRRSYGMLR
jgi:hypothetical protein